MAAAPLPIRVILDARDERALAEHPGLRIGAGGIELATERRARSGQAVAFELVSPDGAVLFGGEGVVVRAAPGGLLLRYRRLDGPQRAVLDRLMLLAQGQGDLGLAEPADPAAPRAALPSAPLALDVGGTLARAAVLSEGAAALVDVTGGRGVAVPAAVAVDDKGRLIFGARARTRRAIEPRSGVASPLPLLTLDPRRADDAAELRRLAFAVRDGKQGPLAELPDQFLSNNRSVPSSLRQVRQTLRCAGAQRQTGGDGSTAFQALPAVELFAAVVSELRSRAQDAAGAPLTGAHLCVPSTLDARARHLLQLGLRRAGLLRPALVDAALAVAAHHGFLPHALPPGPLLVVDWGGTSLQLTVLGEVAGRLDVLAAGQKRHLGGATVDERIARTLLEPVERALGHPLTEPMARQRLVDAAENARRALARSPDVRVRIPFLALSDAGAPVDLDVTLDAAQTLRALEPALDQLLRGVAAVLEGARVAPGEVHRVLLAGGQAAWPRVAERLDARFPGRIRVGADPASSAVQGALRLATADLQRGRAAVRLQEPVSVLGAGGALLRLFERGLALPVRAELRLRTSAPGGVICPLVEGSNLAHGRGYLGAARLAGPVDEVRLAAQIDPRGIIDVDLFGGERHAHARFTLHGANPGIAASVFAQAALPGDRDATPRSALDHAE